MNKQEKNIVDILTFDEIENIVDIFIDKICHTDKTVALITNKELAEFAMGELLNDGCALVRRVDIELEDVEYMISVDDDGNMVVQPIEYYDDKYFMGIEYAFVDMDGCVDQITIDNLIDRDIPVVLFGLDDSSDNYTINGETTTKKEFDEYISQFKKTDASDNSSDDDNSTYHIVIKGDLDMGDAEKIIENMERRMMRVQDIFDTMHRRLFW